MNIPEKIKLINQKDDISCTLACVAMVTGKKMGTIKMAAEELGIKPPCDNLEFLRLLTFFQVLGIPNNVSDEMIYSDALYKVSVPSINSKRGLHAVVIDTRHGDIRVYDPQRGREGKEFYTAENIKSFSSPIKIIDITSNL